LSGPQNNQGILQTALRPKAITETTVQAPTGAACQTRLLLDLPPLVKIRLKGIRSPNAIAPEIDAQFNLLSSERLKYELLNPGRSGSTRSRSCQTCAHTLRASVRSRRPWFFPVCHRNVFSVRGRAPGTISIHSLRPYAPSAQKRWWGLIAPRAIPSWPLAVWHPTSATHSISCRNFTLKEFAFNWYITRIQMVHYSGILSERWAPPGSLTRW